MWPVGDVHTTVPSEIILGYRLFFGLDTAARDKPLGISRKVTASTAP